VQASTVGAVGFGFAGMESFPTSLVQAEKRINSGGIIKITNGIFFTRPKYIKSDRHNIIISLTNCL
jgi:hypothetical protein